MTFNVWIHCVGIRPQAYPSDILAMSSELLPAPVDHHPANFLSRLDALMFRKSLSVTHVHFILLFLFVGRPIASIVYRWSVCDQPSQGDIGDGGGPFDGSRFWSVHLHRIPETDHQSLHLKYSLPFFYHT